LSLTPFSLLHKVSNLTTNHNRILNLFIGEYNSEDFSTEGCDEISSIILTEAKTFVTFMQSMVEEMLGQEDYMLNLLYGKVNLQSKTDDDDEEDSE
jgi:hypothetical protein